jgi:hypothetical protein
MVSTKHNCLIYSFNLVKHFGMAAKQHRAVHFTNWYQPKHRSDKNTEDREITCITKFDCDAFDRRVAKHDAFGTTAFTWEGTPN